MYFCDLFLPPPMKKIILLLSFCLLGFFANAQIDKNLQREAKAVLEEGYNLECGHATHVVDICKSHLLNEVPPLTLKGDIASIQETRYNYTRKVTGHRYMPPVFKGRKILVHWEATPIETVTYSFDTLNHSVEMFVHSLHSCYYQKYHKKSKKYIQQRHGEIHVQQSLEDKNLAFWATNACYTFRDGYPTSYKVLTGIEGDTARYWQYVEGIEYDSANRPVAIFKFSNGLLDKIYTIKYAPDNQIDSVYMYELDGRAIYSLPMFPKNHQKYLKETKSYRAHPNDTPYLLYDYDSNGRLYSIECTSDDQFLGYVWCHRNWEGVGSSINQIIFGYDDGGNMVSKSYGKDDLSQTWTYQYDSYGNWTECEEYVNGVLVSRATRKITYR